MSQSKMRSAYAALFAMLFAILAALALAPTAFAADYAAGTIGTQADANTKLVVFEVDRISSGADTVQENYGWDAAKEVKAYSEDQLKELAKKNTAKIGFLYSGKAKTDPSQVYATDSYIYLNDLLADAGVTVAENDKLMFAAEKPYADWRSGAAALKDAVYTKEGMYPGLYGRELAGALKFFPNHRNDAYDASDAVSADPIIDFTQGSEKIEGENNTAQKALGAVNCRPNTNGYTVLSGITAADYSAGALPGGFMRPKGVWGIVVYHNSLKNATVADIADQTYTGKAIAPAVTVKFKGGEALVNGTDYTVAYKNNTNAGIATVTVTGKGDYEGIITKTFKINPMKITAATPAKTSFTYTGKAFTPAVTVKAGSVVVPAGNYTVAYAKNKAAGTATVTVKAKGSNVTGSTTAKFTIKKASQAISAKAKVTKTLKAKKGKLAKKQVINLKRLAKVKGAKTAVKYKKANKAGGKSIAVNAKTGKITVKKGLKKGTYKVKVKLTAAKNANYNAAKAKTVTVTIKVK